MKTRYLTLFAFLVISLLQSKNHLSATEFDPKYKLKKFWRKYYCRISPVDFNGDGTDELFIEHPKQIDLRNQKAEKTYACFGKRVELTYDFAPLTTGKLDSLCCLMSHRARDSSIIKLFTWQKRKEKERKRNRFPTI